MKISEKQLYSVIYFLRTFSLETDIGSCDKLLSYQDRANDLWDELYSQLSDELKDVE